MSFHRPTTILLLSLFHACNGYAQKIQNLKASAQGEKIIITYDLTGYENDTYDISIFSSHNNFTTALAQVTGDVGKDIKSGLNKRMEWNSKAELAPNFKGQLNFEIRAVVIAHLGFTNPPKSARRGKDISVGWHGGEVNQKIKVELLKGGVVQSTLGSVDNNGSHAWSLPVEQSLGKDYQVRLSDGKETITSGNFPVNRKIPLVLKAVPVVVVGVIVGIIVGG